MTDQCPQATQRQSRKSKETSGLHKSSEIAPPAEGKKTLLNINLVLGEVRMDAGWHIPIMTALKVINLISITLQITKPPNLQTNTSFS